MKTVIRNGRDQRRSKLTAQRNFSMAPTARAIAIMLAASSAVGFAHGQQAFAPAWFAAKGAAQNSAEQTGRLPNGLSINSLVNPAAQQQKARDQLALSIGNLNQAAQAIAAQQATQASARQAALNSASQIPDGLAEGGLKIDTNSLTTGWRNANAPVQTVAAGRTNIAIQQTADKAILNWETFNVGRETTVQFDQQAGWAVLNRVNDPQARPSQIAGQIKAAGTVLIANRNGIVFGGASQVDTRSLVAAAAKITDTQFTSNGIYGVSATTPSFTDAAGSVQVNAGARITTLEPQSVTDGGGYVMLLGKSVSNAGQIETRRGQAAIAAGDSFLVRKGAGTDANQFSTTRGSEIAPQFVAGSTAGLASNTGYMVAREGDITLTGRDVHQDGVAVSTTTVNTRGTIHLLASANDPLSMVTLGLGATTAILTEDAGAALDSQRDALIKESASLDQQRFGAATLGGTSFDNYAALADRRDLSRIEIVAGQAVNFASRSLTLATGGQLVVTAGNSMAGTKELAATYGAATLAASALLDVSGSLGVRVAMEDNNIRVNVQGNELRDAPVNRDAAKLFNKSMWVDRRDLVLVPAGSGGYESDRWYTAGGLLEVSGYLGTQGHGIGEWTAQGGTIAIAADNLVATAGSRFNLSGGTIDVQTGFVNTTWLKGADGTLYTAAKAPADILYSGVYTGYQAEHARWGTQESFYSPLIAPQRRLEEGYTVGRDAGELVIMAANARIDADIEASVFNGARQTGVRPATVTDAYRLSQTQAALAGRVTVRTYDATLQTDGSSPRLRNFADVMIDSAGTSQGEAPNQVWLNLDRINEAGLGGLRTTSLGNLTIGGDLTLAPGGALAAEGVYITLDGNLTARGGSVSLAGGLNRTGDISAFRLKDGVTIDTRGLWTNAALDPAGAWGAAFRNGGAVSISVFGALALESGSRIDASAGGALLPNRSTLGGNGGDVTLSAGGLVLDGGGDISSYGFVRGGKLTIKTPAAISIGGTLLENRGTLAPGEAAPFDLTVGSDFVLPRGTVLPFTLKVSSGGFAKLGEEVPPDANPNISYARPLVTGPNGWRTPISGVFARNPATNVQAAYQAGSLVPAGFLVVAIQNTLPAGYVLPADAFTTAIPIYVRTATYAAGTAFQGDVRVRAGTVLERGAVLPVAAPVLPVFEMPDATAFFQKGFSAYTLSGAAGVIVKPGAQVDVAMPVLRLNPAGAGDLAGDALAAAAEVFLPPLFAENAKTGVLKQRAGADLSMTGGIAQSVSGAAVSPLVTGGVVIGAGATVNVDPGRRIDITSKGQIQVEGTLAAPGGGISITNTRTLADVSAAYRLANPNSWQYEDMDPQDALSVWIGNNAVLDVAGRAYTALDVRGQRYGTVLDGGSVVLGGAGGVDPKSTGVLSTAAYVVVRPGARIDASGASAELNLGGGGVRESKSVASNGGSITLSSYHGFLIDDRQAADGSWLPALRADAGGAGASGGSLSLVLESPVYASPFGLDPMTRPGRALTVAQGYKDSGLAGELAPGKLDSAFVIGRSRISVDQINRGGFDSLSLFGRTAIVFDGDVDLQVGRSVILQKGAIQQTTAGADVRLSAPYVFLDGGTLHLGTNVSPFPLPGANLPAYPKGGSFAIEAGLIDLRNTVGINFDQTRLQSTGDIRFMAATAPPSDAQPNDGTTRRTELRTWGDLELAAAQIYPATGAAAIVRAGLGNPPGGEPSIIQITSTGPVPAQPYSVFGNLTLTADVIRQGGVLRAPFGSLTFNATEVELQAGSVTGIGTGGLVMPFGGTVDGVKYTFNSAEAVKPDLIGGAYSGTLTANEPMFYGTVGLNINTSSLNAKAGSLLDLSGGGQMIGGAFVTGRGGSVDTLLNPLNTGGKVYAIVPGATTAPLPGGYYNTWTGAAPPVGQQVTIPDGVPGLPPGTYTLMPANYALLPGAWRVELGGRTADFDGAVALRNGSYVVSGVQGIANTDIRDSLGTRITLTSGKTFRTYSSYNEQNYSQFQAAQAQTFGALRPMLEADGKRLVLNLRATAGTAANSALAFNGQADFSGGTGGYDGNFSLMGNGPASTALVITADGSTRTNDATTITVSGADVNRVRASNLFIGGTVTKQYNSPNIALTGNIGNEANMVNSVTLEGGVTLTGGQVVIGAKQLVTLEEGATINTLGQRFNWLDSGSGLLFGPAASPFGSVALLLVSNGQFTLDAPSGLFGSAIELKNDTTLYSEGTVGFYSDLGVTLSGTPKIGTRNLSLAVPSFNFGSDASLAAAGTLPAGMSLNQRILDSLFAGNAASGVPSVTNLSLSAAKSINFFGSVNLDTTDPVTGKSRLGQLILNSPAIYGYGSADDVVHLTTDTLVWNNTLSRVTYTDVYQTQYGSALPGAVMAGGPGNGHFQVDAGTIVFGNPALSKPNTAVSFDRLMLGFGNVDFNATGQITANARGTVSFYQNGADPSTAFDPKTYTGTGGTVRMNSPLLTTDPGAVISYYAGGAFKVTASVGATAGTSDKVGGQIDIRAGSIDIASAIVLPSGRLTLSANQDITLSEGALLDVSGRTLKYFDVSRSTWGGDIELESRHGNIVQKAGSTIDVSAAKADAGTLRLSAVDAAQGAVLLGGTLRAHGASGRDDGGFGLSAQRIGSDPANLSADFATLNSTLDTAGFFAARAFAFKQGDLVVGDGVKAHDVAISADGGSLLINGRVDASGIKPGSIRLAAKGDLRLASGASLDAHGTVLQVDSYGQPVEAANRGSVELTSAQGWLRLDSGTTINVSAPDGVARGRVVLNARRADETGGDVKIDASGPVKLVGAASVAVNGFWTYSPSDADGSVMQDNGGTTPVSGAGQVGLNQIDSRSQVFYGNAMANAGLQARLAGLKALGEGFHLRPGVEITSPGTITIKGDIDLGGYRYGTAANRDPGSASYGAGEPMALTVRAGGDLNVKGSITDGFGKPRNSPDDSPILLAAGETLNADYTLLENVTLAAGTKLAAGATLPISVTLSGGKKLLAGQPADRDYVLDIPVDPNTGYNVLVFEGVSIWDGYDPDPVYVVSGQVEDGYWCGCTYYAGDAISSGVLGTGAVIAAGTVLSHSNPTKATIVLASGPSIAANKPLPQQVTLDADYTLAAAVRATGRIVTPAHTYEVNEIIPASTVLPRGTTVGTGASLPFNFEIAGITWQAGNPLIFAGGYTLETAVGIEAGAVLPAGTVISTAGDIRSATTRPVWAIAPMMAAGSASASIRLVGGADLSAADTRGIRTIEALAGKGNVTLDDPRTGNSSRSSIFSVLRTGTGDLDILAGGNFRQATSFGVYTAGTQSDLPSGNAAFMLPRASFTGISDYDNALNAQTTWFPEHGGDLLISAQGDLSGRALSNDNQGNNYDVAAWLWRQGGEGIGQQTAWSINFGTYVNAGSRYNPVTGGVDQVVGIAGFSGMGALGGGNVTLLAGGNAGSLSAVNPYGGNKASEALTVAIGATGRVTGVTTTPDGAVTGGTLVQTGGGELKIKVAGGLNAGQASISNSDGLQGTLTNLRGDIDVNASAVGSLSLSYGTKGSGDPRGADIYNAGLIEQAQTGPLVMIGDGSVSFQTRGDLVLSRFGDATMLPQIKATPYAFLGTLGSDPAQKGISKVSFSLWTPDTEISLISAGGNLMPFWGGKSELPSRFFATAASGSIYYGSENGNTPATIELMPAPEGQLELVARKSIYASARQGPLTVAMSGANAGINDLPNPFKPAWILTPANLGADLASNMLGAGYFAFQPVDTPVATLHAGDAEPIRFYAVDGDIVGAALGGSAGGYGTVPLSYIAAKAARIHAGRDIVGFGMGSAFNPQATPSVIMNANAWDVSTIEAGRDIFYVNANIAGPGTLEVTSGRNFYQGNQGSLGSLGAVIPGDTRPGAGIAVQVGFGAGGAAYDALASLYLNPANQADATPGHPLADQPGKVAHTYDAELIEWLAARFGHESADPQAALRYFRGLPAEQQRVFLRDVYYSELRAGGREYSDENGPREGSYLRGRQAIAALFPQQDAAGNAIKRAGDFIQFGAAGIQTRFGGDIQALVPAGQIIVGVQGEVPPATSGLITQGEGNIQLYSQDSILLGLSRIMTTFGGDILAWSAKGDINAGRGSKTTLVFTPPKRVYDSVGNVKVSPQVPSTGAGIATLAPIAEVPPGDVDLIAPLGTIDAGEAGIRVSGNAYLAALHVVNAENIQVKGESKGIPVVAAVNVGALTNASAAAAQASAAAQDVVQRERAAARQALPSIFTVRVLGFGNEAPAGGAEPVAPARPGLQSDAGRYSESSPVQIVGLGGVVDARHAARLTEEERRRLGQDRPAR